MDESEINSVESPPVELLVRQDAQQDAKSHCASQSQESHPGSLKVAPRIRPSCGEGLLTCRDWPGLHP